MARFSAFTSSVASDPTSFPGRPRGTAVSLSTMIRHGARNPFRVLGWTESLKIGAGVGSVCDRGKDATLDCARPSLTVDSLSSVERTILDLHHDQRRD